MQAAQNAQSEGRTGAAQALAARAYQVRTGNVVPGATTNPADAPPSEDAYDPNEYEGVAQEFFEGVFSGGTRIAQGVFELLATVPDLVADTNYSSAVTEAFDSFREQMGIDPQGLVGRGAEVITQFVIPGAAAARVVGGLSQAGRLGTFIRQVGAAGLADAVVSDNDTTTIGDFFEGGPTQRVEDTGLQGSEEALRRIGNRFRIGLEGGVAQVAAPLLVRGTGRLLGETALAVDRIPGVRLAGPVALARGARRAAQPVVAAAGRLEEALRTRPESVGPFGRFLGETMAAMRYRGVLPQEIAEARLLRAGVEEADIQGALAAATRIDGQLDSVLKRVNQLTAGTTPLTREDALNTIQQALTATNPTRRTQLMRSIPRELRGEVRQMRASIDRLSNDVLGGDFIRQFGTTVPTGATQTIEDTIRNSLGSYMRRRYRIFEDAAYQPDQQVLDAAARGFMSDRRGTETLFRELIDAGKYTPAQLGGNVAADGTIAGAITRQQGELAANALLARYQQSRRPLRGLQRVPEERLQTDLFITRRNLPQYQRALLGEINDPLENYVATVADMAEFRAVDQYFGTIRDLATNPSNANTFGRWFQDTSSMSPAQVRNLEESGYRVLGQGDDPLASGWGSLQGFAVPDRIYRDLTRVVAGDLGAVGNAARSLYGGFLKLKGASQFGATVLSPITQIRNVTTAGLFATMQGNVGRGANLWESLRLTFQNLPRSRQSDMFARLQRLGVIGTQAELREMQDLISRGFGFDTPPTMIAGLPAARRIGSRLTDNPIGAFVAGSGRRAQDLYQAGDDLWKVYNFQFERNKLRAALRQMPVAERQAYMASRGRANMPISQFLDEEAAYVVRNVIPNYNMVPESIRFIRKLPVGNFIAFPYEIVRTSVNTLTRALEELSSTSRGIQEIGMRRLMGAMTTVGTVGPALSKLAYQTSGVSEDEMQAYQRALAPEWERNARLIPTGRHEDGTPQYINFSYSNPYDMITRVFNAAINRHESDRLLGLSPAQTVFNAFSESLSEFVAPFTEESIMTAALRDVLDPNSQVPVVRQLAQLVGGRGGRTITGAQVYSEQDSAGDRAAKSFAHVIDALLPPVLPVNVRSGEFEPSRFGRAVVNALNLNEALGIDERDAQGIERDLSAELARAFSGVTESESQASLGLRYRAFEFAAARTASSNIFNRTASRPNARSEDLLDAFISADQARYRAFNRFYRVIEDLRAFGMSERDIRRVLERAHVTGIGQLLRGRYDPLDVGRTAVQRLRENGIVDRLPRAEINAYRQSRRNIGFGILEEAEEAPEAAAAPQGAAAQPQAAAPQTQVGAASAAPVIAPAPAPAVPQSPLTPANSAPPPLELLGSNPIEALQNLEIAQRR
jgi:hypothetical protein